MRINDSCAACLYDKQKNKADDPKYLARIRELLDNRGEDDTSPYMVYLFNKVHEEFFGAGADYTQVKKTYNDLVLGMEENLRAEIENAADPIAKALVMARIGNYIDFGAMNHVDTETFLGLFRDTELREDEKKTYESFLQACAGAEIFLLLCDNCGEIVLDKLLIEQLSLRFPQLKFYAMVRGGNILNDVTEADAAYVGLDQAAKIVSNGAPVGGTIYSLLPEKARSVLDGADVILSKGQGNYESLSGRGYHVFYALLCKCDLFTSRFDVPRLTGIFVAE
ncbi:MAG: DUF89 family protein [Lachnospiraceae bacterium]|nr:DUF89 family protein [Lachnospiraceae bacterium]